MLNRTNSFLNNKSKSKTEKALPASRKGRGLLFSGSCENPQEVHQFFSELLHHSVYSDHSQVEINVGLQSLSHFFLFQAVSFFESTRGVSKLVLSSQAPSAFDMVQGFSMPETIEFKQK